MKLANDIMRAIQEEYENKVYVTVNTLIKEDEIENVLNYLNKLHEIGVDAVLVQDLGLVDLINKHIPKLKIHASTQMNLENQDKIAVGISGGKDSIVLLYALSLYQKFCPHPFQIVGIHIQLGFPDMDFSTTRDFCNKHQIEFVEYPSDVNVKFRKAAI